MAIFDITGDVRGEAHIVERSSGLGVSATADAVQFVSEHLKSEAA